MIYFQFQLIFLGEDIYRVWESMEMGTPTLFHCQNNNSIVSTNKINCITVIKDSNQESNHDDENYIFPSIVCNRTLIVDLVLKCVKNREPWRLNNILWETKYLQRESKVKVYKSNSRYGQKDECCGVSGKILPGCDSHYISCFSAWMLKTQVEGIKSVSDAPLPAFGRGVFVFPPFRR